MYQEHIPKNTNNQEKNNKWCILRKKNYSTATKTLILPVPIYSRTGKFTVGPLYIYVHN